MNNQLAEEVVKAMEANAKRRRWGLKNWEYRIYYFALLELDRELPEELAREVHHYPDKFKL